MQQLPALDSVFLSMETPETPGHIGGLAVLDPSTHPENDFHFDEFVDFVQERIALCPRFSWRAQEVPLGLDLPYWVKDRELDVRQHIHRVAVPSPGGAGELAELAGLLGARALDRSLPLWEMFLIEGLQGGRIGLLWKVHHCLMDGVSGAGIAELLFDLAPVPADQPLVPVNDSASASGSVSNWEMARTGVRNASRRPAALLGHLGRAAAQALSQVREAGLEGIAAAPNTSLNGNVGPRRSLAWARVSLDRVKRSKNALDVTVNDIVLALTSDAVRGYLKSRDELPSQSLVAGVPVSIRQQGDTAMGNQISEVGITWATHLADPIERALVIHQASTLAKESAKAKKVNILEAISESLAPGVVSLFARLTSTAADMTPLPSNAVVSNVPMSPVPLFIAGAQIEGMVPMSLLAPTQGFNITVLSYAGELHFGLVGDPDLVENIWEIADGIPKALVALEEATASDPRFRATD